MAVPSPAFRYPAPVRWIHWLSVVLVAVAYLTAESAEESGGAGRQWHILAGLLLLVLFVPRLLARLAVHGVPPISRSAFETWSARLVHLALLLFVVVEPLLGVLMLWAEGEAVPVPFTAWQLPPLLVPGEAWEEILEEAHATVGNVFYAVIALHVLASLWHQFFRRDGVLRRMW